MKVQDGAEACYTQRCINNRPAVKAANMAKALIVGFEDIGIDIASGTSGGAVAATIASSVPVTTIFGPVGA
jgi:hypothetical protein